ncbi:hypothetical protein [Mucilaginibacter ginsenosidivorans]|uniref:Uncharacterized protein n=1 Tax=Mucilaginibacter ginsenosidivorans TaxID=398053 RepID=A0A5B8V420_9SPHI|nr:hypothetical protein [Mucilaginibacter ginsenosidivorans]QEC65451.1 hypothetical protein FRZ54_23735 [Mucilaginibacter ginsenosidivorans]
MNWIIHQSDKLEFLTYLDEILKPLDEYIDGYNWVISGIDGGGGIENAPIDYEQKYFILTAGEFRKVLHGHIQLYWGTIIAIPVAMEIKIDEKNLPYSEGNELIWQNGHLQCPDAEIEVDCFDSAYTIVKFTREILSEKFKSYFDEAIPLEEFD